MFHRRMAPNDMHGGDDVAKRSSYVVATLEGGIWARLNLSLPAKVRCCRCSGRDRNTPLTLVCDLISIIGALSAHGPSCLIWQKRFPRSY